MEPLLTAQTRLNILTAFKWIGIPSEGVLFSEEPEHNDDRSRVVIFDRHGLILRYIREHSNDWTEDSGQNHNAHGFKVRRSYRSKKNNGTPSLQFCKVDSRGGEYDYWFIVDLDEANPYCNFPVHAWECLRNMAPQMYFQRVRTTDPFKIAAMLQRAIAA